MTPNSRPVLSSRLALCVLMGALVTLPSCSTLKSLGKKDTVVARAEKSETDYYQEAQEAITKKRFNQASVALTNLRTFYPTGRYAEQALLDLIYVQYNANNYEAVTETTTQFISSYPTSSHLDYALYAQGVTHMDGSPKASRLFRLDQSQRDTAYLRLAFSDFQRLLTRYPNSVYAPDAAQRMTHIYNQFAAHELQAAKWYIKRNAYVAAAERARWVFQYYPQSSSVPEAIAILAYANDKLGITSTADQYKTLLQINYPQYLSTSGQVLLDIQKGGWVNRTLHTITFGKLGRVTRPQGSPAPAYAGNTYTQQITQAQGLSLAPTDSNEHSGTANTARGGVRFGLGLSPTDAQAGNLNSSQTAASDATTTQPTPNQVPPTARTQKQTQP